MQAMLVVLDGAADRKVAALGNKTPLEAAATPNLDRIAMHSHEGMLYPIGRHIAPESDAAVLSLLSYDINKDYTGRGPLEALGAGLRVYGNTLALRCNFATIDKKRNIVDRRAGRSISRSEARRLERLVNSIKLSQKGVRFKFRATVGHRGVVAFYSKSFRFSANVSNADIGYVKRGNISVAKEKVAKRLPDVKALDKSESSAKTALLLNEFIGKVIGVLGNAKVNRARQSKNLPEANALLLRDAGVGLPRPVPISRKFGIRFAFVTEMPVETGIARLLGMHEMRVRRAASKVAYYKNIAKALAHDSHNFDFAYVHLKGPDEPGHDGDAMAKKKAIEDIDKGFFAALPKSINATVCVTCDHSTPCELKAHSSDPVPVMIKSRVDGDDSMRFTEEIDSKGSLGMFYGKELISKMLGIE